MINDLKLLFREGKITKSDFITKALSEHKSLFEYVTITENTDVKEIRINRDGIRFEMYENSIYLFSPKNEGRVAPIEIMNFDRYEPFETTIMDILSLEARQILDIGANIGWHSLRLAKKLPDVTIHSFEPMPETYKFLQKNIAENNLGLSINAYNYGLSDKNGCFEFFIAPENGTNASLKNVAGVDNAKKVLGLAITLDDWCQNMSIKVDFIKCDVEGAELLVFKGGNNTLKRDRPIIFTELLRKWTNPFGYHPNDLLTFLQEIGYKCYAISDKEVHSISEITEDTLETNYAFLHQKDHLPIIAKLDNISSK